MFGPQSRIDPLALVRLVQSGSGSYKLQGSHRLQFRGELPELEDRFRAIEKLLESLAVKESVAETGQKDS